MLGKSSMVRRRRGEIGLDIGLLLGKKRSPHRGHQHRWEQR